MRNEVIFRTEQETLTGEGTVQDMDSAAPLSTKRLGISLTICRKSGSSILLGVQKLKLYLKAAIRLQSIREPWKCLNMNLSAV